MTIQGLEKYIGQYIYICVINAYEYEKCMMINFYRIKIAE